MNDELLLINKARALDPEALEQIHDLYYVPIYRYCAYRVHNHQVAEDLTSEVFMRLISALRDRNAPNNTIRGWLFKVASRVVNDHYRKKYKRQHTELDENLPTETDSPMQAFEKMSTNRNLREAIKQLTLDQQNVIAFRFGFDMSIREVAEHMGKSEGSVKMLQARAIAALGRTMTVTGTQGAAHG